MLETPTTGGGPQTAGVKGNTGPDGNKTVNSDLHKSQNEPKSFLMECLLHFRGNRIHKGLDIVCDDRAIVYAPFNVTLNGGVIVYTDPRKKAINNGINLSGESLFTFTSFSLYLLACHLLAVVSYWLACNSHRRIFCDFLKKW